MSIMYYLYLIVSLFLSCCRCYPAGFSTDSGADCRVDPVTLYSPCCTPQNPCPLPSK